MSAQAGDYFITTHTHASFIWTDDLGEGLPPKAKLVGLIVRKGGMKAGCRKVVFRVKDIHQVYLTLPLEAPREQS